MKKFLILMLSLLMIVLSFSACSDETVKEDGSSLENIETKDVNYNFYVGYAWGTQATEKTKDFKNVSELRLGLGRKQVVLNNVTKTKTIVIDDKEITLGYKGTTVSDIENLTFNKYNRGFDEYTSISLDESSNVNVKYRKDNGEMCFCSLSVGNGSTKILSETEYRNFAVEELNRRLPANWNDVYSDCKIEINESLRMVAVTFNRAPWYNCSVFDHVIVWLDYDGRVNCFDTRLYGLFDEVVETVTKEQLDAAYNALKERLDPDGSKSTLSTTQYLHLDNTGTLYMSVSYNEVSTDKNGDKCDHSAIVYVNVN